MPEQSTFSFNDYNKILLKYFTVVTISLSLRHSWIQDGLKVLRDLRARLDMGPLLSINYPWYSARFFVEHANYLPQERPKLVTLLFQKRFFSKQKYSDIAFNVLKLTFGHTRCYPT